MKERGLGGDAKYAMTSFVKVQQVVSDGEYQLTYSTAVAATRAYTLLVLSYQRPRPAERDPSAPAGVRLHFDHKKLGAELPRDWQRLPSKSSVDRAARGLTYV